MFTVSVSVTVSVYKRLQAVYSFYFSFINAWFRRLCVCVPTNIVH